LNTGYPALTSNLGVFGAGVTGVQGVSASGVGVLGQSNSPNSGAIHGISTAFDGVVGETSSSAHAGVTGRITSPSPGPNACGVYGDGGPNGGVAGKFDGKLQVNGDHHCTGTMTVDAGLLVTGNVSITGDIASVKTVTVSGDVILTGADCAEHFDVADAQPIEPGTVVVIDDEGALRESRNAYDRKVAGVVSGAGEYRPGIVLDGRESSRSRAVVALMGKVYCKVDAKYAPIGVGDLLTASPTPGHAMKATDRNEAFGAVIGKALRRLDSGTGLIPMLIALQ